MKKLTLAAFLLFTSLYSFADGVIVLDQVQMGILGTGEDYDDELDIMVLDADGELMEIDIVNNNDKSLTIRYNGEKSGEFVIVKVYNKRTNKTTYLKYRKA